MYLIEVQKKSFFLCLSTAILLYFNNCSDVEFQGPDKASTFKYVNTLCSNNKNLEYQQNLFFEKPNKTCEWNKDGNLDIRNEYFQARIEQIQKLDLPEGAIICDAQFDIPKQSMKYDDHFLISMDNVLLASTYDFEGFLKKDNFMYIYEWKNIAGMYWDKNMERYGSNSYCLGREEFGSDCSWPKTDTNGEMKLQFPFEVIQNVSAQDLQRTHHEIKVISLGDNDEWDCEHSDIEFDVYIKYVIDK